METKGNAIMGLIGGAGLAIGLWVHGLFGQIGFFVFGIIVLYFLFEIITTLYSMVDFLNRTRYK